MSITAYLNSYEILSLRAAFPELTFDHGNRVYLWESDQARVKISGEDKLVDLLKKVFLKPMGRKPNAQ